MFFEISFLIKNIYGAFCPRSILLLFFIFQLQSVFSIILY